MTWYASIFVELQAFWECFFLVRRLLRQVCLHVPILHQHARQHVWGVMPRLKVMSVIILGGSGIATAGHGGAHQVLGIVHVKRERRFGFFTDLTVWRFACDNVLE